MPQRQQDSVCAQIIPCSSWLFSIFLNRHCTESGIRNGPVISLIASTDKSKWVNFFKDTTDSNPKCSSSSSQPSLPQWCGPPWPALIPGWARTQMAERAPPPDKTHLHPVKAGTQRGRPRSQRQHVLGHLSSCYPEVDPKSDPESNTGELLCYQELLHPTTILNSHVQASYAHIHDSRLHKPAHIISDLTDVNSNWGLSPPSIFLEFSKFLLLATQGNRQVPFMRR